jgi:hypothetical protein
MKYYLYKGDPAPADVRRRHDRDQIRDHEQTRRLLDGPAGQRHRGGWSPSHRACTAPRAEAPNEQEVRILAERDPVIPESVTVMPPSRDHPNGRPSRPRKP